MNGHRNLWLRCNDYTINKKKKANKTKKVAKATFNRLKNISIQFKVSTELKIYKVETLK